MYKIVSIVLTLPMNARVEPGHQGAVNSTLKDVLASVRAAQVREGAKRGRAPSDEEIARQLMHAYETNGAPAELDALLESLTLLMAKQQRRVIGVALSNAESGEQFDILLRGGGAF